MPPSSDRPTHLELDAAWRRFITSGCPEALAAVYDGSSPVLVLLATRLLGERRRSPERAYDLLQTTFLEAIRTKDRFDLERPVLPWLTSILIRRAHDQRRSDRRRQARDLGASRLESQPPAESPAEQAEATELRELVAAAIQELGTPYRTVLHLHLLHELSPLEISTALERPLNTVHSQLRRGLERLRGRLPRHLASAVPSISALGISPGSASTAKTSVLTTALVMKKPAALLAATVILIAAIAHGVREVDTRQPTSPSATLEATGLANISDQATRTSSSRTGRPARRQPVASPPAEEQNASRSTALPLAHGRCVDQFGQPVANAEIELLAKRGSEGRSIQSHSDAHGHFRITIEPERIPTVLPLAMRFRAPDCLERQVNDRSGDLGEVQMIRGGHVRARLAPGALGAHTSWDATALHLGTSRSGTRLNFPNPEHTFESQTALRPGIWRFHAKLSHAYDIQPPEFEVRAGETTVLEISPRVHPGISGTVVKQNPRNSATWQDGRPRIVVEQRKRGSVEEADDSKADVDGKFTVWLQGDPADPPTPTVRVGAPGHASRSVDVPWGTTNVTIALESLPRIRLHVTNTDGSPVHRFEVSVSRDPEALDWQAVAADATGTRQAVEIARHPGRHAVHVRANSPQRGTAGPLFVDLIDQDIDLEVQLRTTLAEAPAARDDHPTRQSDRVQVVLTVREQLPDWLDRVWLQLDARAARTDQAPHREPAIGHRLGSAFWFEDAPVGRCRLLLLDPTRHPAAMDAPLVELQPDEGQRAEPVRSHVTQQLRVPGRVRVPRLDSHVGLEIYRVAHTEPLWRTAPGHGGNDVHLPEGAYRAVWIRTDGAPAVTDSFRIAPGATTTVRPPREH